MSREVYAHLRHGGNIGWMSRQVAPQHAEICQTWLIRYIRGIVARFGMNFVAGAGIFVARERMRQTGIVKRPTLP